MVDTSTVIPGPPRGTDTINEPPQGPFCVAPGLGGPNIRMLAASSTAGIALLVLGGIV